MELSSEQGIFLLLFFGLWFLFSFVVILIYGVIDERRKCGQYAITVKDIFLGIIFFPLTFVIMVAYLIMWLLLEKLGGNFVIDHISDFLNKPIKFGGKKDE